MLAARPTHSPCLMPLRVVAPAKPAPTSATSAEISILTSCACNFDVSARLLLLARSTNSRMACDQTTPTTITKAPAHTRPKWTGPASMFPRPTPKLGNTTGVELLISSSGILGVGRQINMPSAPPRAPAARCMRGAM